MTTALPATALLTPVAPKPAVVDGKVATALSNSPTADVIVGFRSQPTDDDIRSLVRAGFTGPFLRYSVVPAVAATTSAASLKAILANPRVSRVEFDETLNYNLDRATAVTRVKPVMDATYQSGGVTRTSGIRGRGVTVAVIDSGIDGRHPDLRDKTLANGSSNWVLKGNFIMAGRTNVNEAGNILLPEVFGADTDANRTLEASATAIPAPLSDNGGHGTHVAGTVAGRGTASNYKFVGVAPSAKLVGLSVGEVTNVSRGLAAIDWVHNNHRKYGIKVATNSWGGAGSEALTDSLLYAAVQRLINDDGVTVLFAAGNDGGDGTAIMTSSQCNIPDVICVANYYDRTGYLDTSSSRGLKTNENTWPDLAAPGTQIISAAMLGGAVTAYGTAQDALISQLDGTGEPIVVPAPLPKASTVDAGGNEVIVGDYASLTGTSMATPAVAGIVALLLEANPTLNPHQIKAILRSTATMLPGRSYATDGFELGTGVADAAEAVAVALKMKDGLSLADALGQASLDLTTQPAQINMGPGPVTDQTIPLYPFSTAPPSVTADPHIYQAGALDVFGLSGEQRMVRGTPVSLAARTIKSVTPSINLTADNFSVTFFLMRGTRVLRRYEATITADDVDYQATYDLEQVPGYDNTVQFVAELTHGASVYRLFDIPVRIVNP